MKRVLKNIDKPLLFMSLLYSIIGLIMIFSASSVSTVLRYNLSPSHYFIKQLIVFIMSYIGAILVLVLPIKFYKKYIPLLIIFMLCSLFGVLSYGFIAGGARSWFDLGFFSLQPAEFAKSIMILYIAFFFGKIKSGKNNNKYFYLIPLMVGGASCILIALQPDLGGAVILAAIIGLLYVSIPYVRKEANQLIKIILGLVVVIGVILIFSGNKLINSTQLKRFVYKAPCSRYSESTGYQVCNGFIALNNGELFGLGLGNSTQKYLYLPESHTDFIFPIIVEELGVIVGALIIIGYIFMLYRIYKIAKRATNIRNALIAYGTFIFFLLHLLINFMGILALIPLTGVPIPFLSYGGSFNLNIIIMIFLCQRVAYETKIERDQREIKNI